ncbi:MULTISPECIES: PTS sugar transporter subunit IIB [Heyndrickxia]|jgi:PTS system cellobiose-specific IIB component|uniref:PTS sugar transporter subunit IIB n=1 Tax=Heyndrickxia oleronia TaxID=38875 RepID=A0A8E2LF74_9BACI|nr:PTS sugar transporter subunit IIB [Heyndrickxia oleronia]NYV63743.1 PTS sugar transporter subunit IIB [Bacillus sp. Gen3]OJH19645.1 PTS sugar transporter subunit IIB [Bacillus obstructivus]MBU5213277.1 PTS sugar transporter subunit IIB [Heyndrickxia oleronia]MCI1591399.1 PTS sugar transporter subunit IIB [Heyndrickxia oleronia]MCI1613873.1 PTS sugar transporter subunit IIB [Heyndrickxia oleronia]
MKKIMLVCSAGMSTSLLVTKMEKAAVEKGEEIQIFAVAEAEAKNHFEEIDVLLLGPQVRFLKGKLEKQLDGKGIPVQVIDSIDYGTMNGDAVLTKALQLL